MSRTDADPHPRIDFASQARRHLLDFGSSDMVRWLAGVRAGRLSEAAVSRWMIFGSTTALGLA
jgi:hypothetical protein